MRTLTFNRIIGAGAMGTVYLAELRVPRGFSRTCAVKVMKTAAGDHEHFMARMRDEARLLGMLQDEQVLGVSELVMVDGRDAVIMEYVEGVDLGEVVKAINTVPARALAELGAEVAGTLHRAHGARHPTTGEPLRVIHRDVKPANVMVTSRGGVRLLDFGVARAAFSSRESHTQGLVLGTLNYFPPEILAGQDPTPAVDIYGLGLTMWECATGKDWGAPRVQQKRFEQRVDRRIEELGPEYKALVAVMRQVLQWDPKLRPDGDTVERALLQAADSCPGEGLRTWSRDVVPQMLQHRLRTIGGQDALVGRTFPIETSAEDSLDGADPAVASALPPPPPAHPPPPPSRSTSPPPQPADPTRSYDDLGPPAATVRRDASSEPVAPTQRPSSRPKPPGRRRRSRGPSVLVMVALGAAIGGAVGLVALAFLAVLLFLVS